MSFSDELNRVSRTASQAEADKNQEMYERGVREADFVYSSIKSKLMQIRSEGGNWICQRELKNNISNLR